MHVLPISVQRDLRGAGAWISDVAVVVVVRVLRHAQVHGVRYDRIGVTSVRHEECNCDAAIGRAQCHLCIAQL